MKNLISIRSKYSLSEIRGGWLFGLTLEISQNGLVNMHPDRKEPNLFTLK